MKSKNSFKKITISSLTLLYAHLLTLSVNANAIEQNPVSSYLFQGKPVKPWIPSVGNGLEWFIPVVDQNAETKRKNLTISPAKKSEAGDALSVVWKGKKVKNEWGGNTLYDSSFTLGRHKIDISSVKDHAALAIEMKIIRAPTENTHLAIQCKNDNNNCSSQFHIKHVLKNLPEEEWITLPIPLACFSKTSKGDDFDFSNVTAMSIATQGKLELEIATIALVALPEGQVGCN